MIAVMRPEAYARSVEGLYSWANKSGVNGPAVEVGTFSGENAVIMAKYFNSVVTVDPWMNGYDKDDHASNADMAEVEKKYFESTACFPNISHLKLTSLEGANEFKDASLDFVYLDGDHRTDAVVADIDAWKPKIRKGGILAGHDINMAKVYDALQKRLMGITAMVFPDTSWGIII
jgi:predicted O-methyltransferase YrrM